jgi:hypothetical protein
MSRKCQQCRRRVPGRSTHPVRGPQVAKHTDSCIRPAFDDGWLRNLEHAYVWDLQTEQLAQ